MELGHEREETQQRPQQIEDEVLLRQHERELENERKNAKAYEEQMQLEFELTKVNSREEHMVSGRRLRKI